MNNWSFINIMMCCYFVVSSTSFVNSHQTPLAGWWIGELDYGKILLMNWSAVPVCHTSSTYANDEWFFFVALRDELLWHPRWHRARARWGHKVALDSRNLELNSTVGMPTLQDWSFRMLGHRTKSPVNQPNAIEKSNAFTSICSFPLAEPKKNSHADHFQEKLHESWRPFIIFINIVALTIAATHPKEQIENVLQQKRFDSGGCKRPVSEGGHRAIRKIADANLYISLR